MLYNVPARTGCDLLPETGARPARASHRRHQGSGDDGVGTRQHALAVDVEDRPQRVGPVAGRDPALESLGVVRHLGLQLLLHGRGAIDTGESLGEGVVGADELLVIEVGRIEPVFRRIVLHGEQRHA